MGFDFRVGAMNCFDIRAIKTAIALACGLAFGVSSPVLAQVESTETVPQPPPSIENFSLPPGDSATPPPPTPTGPVDDTAPPVTAPAPVNPATEEAESPEVPATPPAAANTETQGLPSRTPADQTPQREPVTERARSQPSQPSEAPVPQIDEDEQDSPPNEAVTEEEVAPQTSERTDELDRTPIEPASTSDEQTPDQSIFYLFALLITVLLFGSGFWIWHKKNKPKHPESDTPVATSLEESKHTSDMEDSEPAPAAAPSEPIAETKTDAETSSDGFVTSKIRKTETKPETRPVKAALSDRLGIEFHAESASSTLVNAVVGYRLSVRNTSNQQISDLHISGTMIQADKNLVETAASSQGQLLHEIGSLKNGEEEQVSGEIRLPLAAFQPIDFQSQKLFVPLILLRFDYIDSEGNPQMQAVNYLVGSEHVPPREKMAPFRLDLGPRNFGKVAHRPFQS